MDTYDIIVIGSGPAGQKAAIAAAKLGHRAAIVERYDMVGGVCINTGTIPSKTLREAVLYLTGMNQRELYGQSYRVKDEITFSDLSARTAHVIAREIDVIRNQLARNHVTLVVGTARFVDPHTVVAVDHTGHHQELAAEKIVIAVGTRPARPDTVDFDGATIVDSDQILGLDKVPSSMVVVGAGVIGIEYASMFAALGTKVTVVEKRPTMLDFCDKEIVEALQYQLRDLAVTFRYSESVREVQKHPAGTLTILESGKKIPADTVLYSAGRQGVTDQLNVAAAGISASNRGRVEVNEHFQTEVEHIYAVGDVIGFPALAATAMEQGRRATYHAFGEPVGNKLGDLQPIGIYCIPEISFVGRTEEQLTRDNVPFEVGVSRYRELARGAILGDSYGMLKMLVHAESRELLGVHVFGTNATELVHIGQTVMGCGGTVDYLVDAVFNYPTLAESYKVAALDAVNKMRAIAKVTQTGAYHPLPE
ncbi:MAG TPA: Si-specific NAD(P)(+) transhydrogenase [Nakamurella sp.]|nr:Si-specific NAD(P)(+) transhydrogenase [Nakamurella sp.]